MKNTLLALTLLFSVSSFAEDQNPCSKAARNISEYSKSLGRIEAYVQIMESETDLTSDQLFRFLKEIGINPESQQFNAATLMIDVLKKVSNVETQIAAIAEKCFVKNDANDSSENVTEVVEEGQQ